MLKEPHPGRVKTRLGGDIGLVAAAWWFRHQANRLIRRLAPDPRWRLILAVAPDREGLASRVWPKDVWRVPQGRGDLGARMRRVFQQAPIGPVVIIGADVPAIAPHHIAGALTKLGDHDVVFGPADDGGFWLVGLRNGHFIPHELFAEVRWSTEHSLTDSLTGLQNLRIGFLETLRDVDRAGDL